MDPATPPEQLLRRLRTCGQAHLLRFWGELAPDRRSLLERDIASIDFEALARLWRAPTQRTSEDLADLQPLPAWPPVGAERARAAEEESARDLGRQALARGQVGCLTVAGGQASRLGVAGPKGAFAIGPVSGRSLFEIFAQNLRAIEMRCGIAPPWWIMTSAGNDGATRAFFQDHSHFGLDPRRVHFFVQSQLPALDEHGKLLLEDKDRILRVPTGHGDAFAALQRAGALATMRALGIEYIACFQVDNPLVRVVDPLFLGRHILERAQISCKVVSKRHPREQMGCIGRLGERTVCIEYSDLPAEIADARTATGELLHALGGISIYVFSLPFIEGLMAAAGAGPALHPARKELRALDERGRPIAVRGVKFEAFIFDVLPLAQRIGLQEVRREEEFAPLKNARGDKSPETVRATMLALHRRWLQQAGVKLEPGVQVEISPLWAMDAEEARSHARRWKPPAGSAWYLAQPHPHRWPVER